MNTDIKLEVYTIDAYLVLGRLLNKSGVTAIYIEDVSVTFG